MRYSLPVAIMIKDLAESDVEEIFTRFGIDIVVFAILMRGRELLMDLTGNLDADL